MNRLIAFLPLVAALTVWFGTGLTEARSLEQSAASVSMATEGSDLGPSPAASLTLRGVIQAPLMTVKQLRDGQPACLSHHVVGAVGSQSTTAAAGAKSVHGEVSAPLRC